MSSSTPAPPASRPTSTARTTPTSRVTASAREVLVLPAEDVVVVDDRGRGPDQPGRTERVTDARGAHSEDVSRRMRTYAVSMGVRTACVLAAALSFPHWWAWLFVPGAVVLPYVAVVLANVGGERVPVSLPPVVPPATGPPVLPAR